MEAVGVDAGGVSHAESGVTGGGELGSFGRGGLY